MFCRILAEGRCSQHTMHRCLRFLRRGICPNLNHFLTTNFRIRCFCLCQFCYCFCVSAKMHRNRGRPFKTSGTAKAREDFDSLKFCRIVFSSALKLRNRGLEATLWKCYPPVIWENQGKKHQRQKWKFSEIQLCNSSLFFRYSNLCKELILLCLCSMILKHF